MQAADAPGRPERSPIHSIKDALIGPVLAVLTGVLSGSLSALFLWSLDRVNLLRIAHPGLLLGLPAAGVLVVWAYSRFGAGASTANTLILGTLNRSLNSPARVPVRTIPLILGGSLVSQLFGASTGREGAAVQMGAGGATLVQRLLGVPRERQLELLRCGVAAGFASIFGTPIAGAVFAVEAPSPGSPALRALPLALVASFAGHLSCLALGGSHAHYAFELPPLAELFEFKLLAGLIGASVAFGGAGALFVKTLGMIQTTLQGGKFPQWSAPLFGGSLLAALGSRPGMEDYLGLGVHAVREGAVSLGSAFSGGGAAALSWLHKLFFTALSLGSGFKGGEVTPLFFIGATLGNSIAFWLDLPTPLFAGLGFVCVFAGAAHAPLTGVAIAVELFGPQAAAVFAPACWIAHKSCCRPGIYTAQSK
jgi:H+/Cl- antiporter ClcA